MTVKRTVCVAAMMRLRASREGLGVLAPGARGREQLAERRVAADPPNARSTVSSTDVLKKAISTCTVSVARPYALSRPPS